MSGFKPPGFWGPATSNTKQHVAVSGGITSCIESDRGAGSRGRSISVKLPGWVRRVGQVSLALNHITACSASYDHQVSCPQGEKLCLFVLPVIGSESLEQRFTHPVPEVS